MTPEMCLDLEPILHRASRNLPQIARIPRGFSTVLPCSLLGATSHVLRVDVGAALLLVDLVPRLGGLGHQNFSRLCRRPGVPCGIKGRVGLDLMSPTSHTVTKRLGAALQCWLGRFSVPIGLTADG